MKKPRDRRQRIIVPARMNAGGRELPVMILNVSQRGVLASSSTPPPRGHYVEIRKGGVVIIGRVAWSGNQVFGVRTQDDIDFSSLTGIRSAGRPDNAAKVSGKDDAATLRRTDKAGSLSAYDQSRIVSSRMTYVSSFIVSCAVAAAAGALAYELLSKPIETIREALSPRES
jgi:hypothetical protein